MVTYEITAVVAADLVSTYEAFMRERHIPGLLATGDFAAASFARSSPGRYRIRYEARDKRSLDHYLAENAAALRADFDAHFPTGVELTREVWEVLQAWPDPAYG